MLLPLTTVTLIGLFLVLRGRDHSRNGLRLGLWAWTLSVFLAALPILTYTTTYTLRLDAFIAASLAALAGGYLVARVPRAPVRESKATLSRDLTVALWVGALGAVGCVLLLIDARNAGTELSLSFLTNNLNTIRSDSFLRGAGQKRTGLATLGNYLSPATLLYVTVSWRFKGLHPWIRPLNVISVALILLVSLFVYAARQPMIVALLLVLSSRWLRGSIERKVNLRTVLRAIFALVAVWLLAISFVSARQGATGNTESEYYLQKVSRAQYAGWIAPAARDIPVLGQALFQISYYSSPLPTLGYYMASSPIPGPYLGQYSFPTVVSVLRIVAGASGPNPWPRYREKVFLPLTSRGYYGNVWPTWLRDLYVDFGYFTIMFTFLFGVLMARARNRFEATRSVFPGAVEAYCAVIFGFGAFQNLLYMNYALNGLMIAIGITLWQWLREGFRLSGPHQETSRALASPPR